jgi:hypothetical protein
MAVLNLATHEYPASCKIGRESFPVYHQLSEKPSPITDVQLSIRMVSLKNPNPGHQSNERSDNNG